MKRKIYVSIILLFIILNIMANNSYAVGTISSQISTTSLNVNATGNINVIGTNATGTFKVTSSNSSVVAIGEYDNWIENNSKQINFTAKSTGTATVTVSTVAVYDSDDDEKKISYSKQYEITVSNPSTPSNNNNTNNNNKEEEDLPTASDGATVTTVKSSNNYLKSLSLSTGNINFNKKTTQYTIDVEEKFDSITIAAAAEHEKASVKGSGKVALEKGSNTINIVVTAENGSARNYVLIVNRASEKIEEKEEIIGTLTSLTLKGVKDNGEIVEIFLNPEFATDVFYYECEIPEGINLIDVETEHDILDAIVEVTGNENLVEGENLINIIIKYTDENEEEQVITYQISANKKSAVIEQEVLMEEEKELSPIQIGVIAGSISIALTIIIVLIVRYRKQQNEDDYDEMDFGEYGKPFYSEEEETEILEKPINTSYEEKEEPTEEKKLQEEIESWNDYEPTKKRKIFGKNAKNGKHF